MLVTLKNSLVIFAAITLVSCNNYQHHSIKGNGNIITQKRNIDGNFKSIEASNGIEVIIEQADRTRITVEADDNLQNSIITEVKNGVLIISRKNGNYSSKHGQKVYITVPVIEGLTANSASSIKTKNTLKGENINLNTSSAAKIEAELSIDNIKANSSSASKIDIKGMALHLDAESSSGSNIDAENLLANNITAQTSSGSKVSVHPILSLKADASSGSRIEYHNNPKQIEKTASSGASIESE
ncbi:lipoprotein [Flavobacterium palustre]|uniref:Lipoprotein n=1 Tax=Flavobacterium palustre TaxID=1476463 RepID=A0ABQ1HK41_9FLAO|nr:head GIN domain-containing protein [Flavobacterium palustre]GGA79855.1 lipoprotein [Flavobacterium palustre]